ncbi:MerR family transcriptional regulator [Thermobacillus sp.]|uniref:MerR family transcriptional regulator n=1 Tax=Thermobacillus sp. TaxID=2108467 RepID=UPI002685D536
MKIKEAAERLGISQRAIRFYEKQGLLSPSRQQHNGYRAFGEEDIWRLQTIVALREAGMPIADIRTALAEIDANDEGRLMELLELQRSVMFAKWVEMKQMIETADRMIETLRQNRTLPIDDMYQLAEGSRRLREQRPGRTVGGSTSRPATTTGSSGKTRRSIRITMKRCV